MICPRCLNTDPLYFGNINGKVYCRKCVKYGKSNLEDYRVDITYETVDYHLGYQLTNDQLKTSKMLVERFKKNLNTTMKAVCGAGKTEIIYELLKYALNEHKVVCFTTPRKELVIELAQRIEQQFRGIKPVLVYGGHTENVIGQFVICTTHQLFRYRDYFDLLILDEQDAFPYNGDIVLNNLLMTSIKGNYVFMSATINDGDLVMNHRYHGGLLPVPKCIIMPNIMMIITMFIKIYQYRKQCKSVLVFVPSIKDTDLINRILHLAKIKSAKINSKTNQNEKYIDMMKKGTLDVIVCTTILERGITIDNVQVIVLYANHRVFNINTLIQIAGRVGRKIPNVTGEVLFLTNYINKDIRKCIQIITKDNA